MSVFYRKPLALCLFAFTIAVAIFSCKFIGTGVYYVTMLAILGLLTLTAVFTAIRKNVKIIIYLLCPLLFFAAGATEITLYRFNVDKNTRDFSKENTTIVADIEKRVFTSNFLTVFEIKTQKIGGEKAKVKMLLNCPYASDVQEGFRIETTVDITKISENDTSDAARYYASKGIYLTAEEGGETYSVLDENVRTCFIDFNLLAKKFTRLISKGVKGDEGGLVGAVSLGNREGLTDKVKRDFTRAGIFHLLALSGLHLSVITSSAEKILKLLKVRRGIRCIILTLLILFYIALTGFGLSVIRSGIMLLTAYFAYFLRSEKDSFTALLFSAAAICAGSPSSVYDTGLWLSVFSTFGIIVFVPLLTEHISYSKITVGKVVCSFVSSIVTSFAAVIATLPIEWIVFGKVSLTGPICTLACMPFVTAILLLNPLFLLFARVAYIGSALAEVLRFCAGSIIGIASRVSALHGVELSLGYDFVGYFIITTFIAVVILLVFRIKYKWILSAMLILSFALCGICYYYALSRPEISMEYYVMEKNEYFGLSEHGENVMIDISDGSFSKMSEAVKKICGNGFCEIDTLVLTHYHRKHNSSINRLIRRSVIRRVVLPEPIDETERRFAADICETCIENGVKVIVWSKNSELLFFGDERVKLVRDYIYRSTHPVLALEFDGAISADYLGSSFAECFEGNLSADRIILGIHGPVCKNMFELGENKVNAISFASDTLIPFLDIKTKKSILDRGALCLVNTHYLRITGIN